MNINEIILDCVKRGINVSLSYNREKERLEYVINIGSKTGVGNLYQEEERLTLETRYQTKDEIDSFDDIVSVAYRWYDNYKDREPFTQPDSQWAKVFLEKGWIKEQTITKYVAAK